MHNIGKNRCSHFLHPVCTKYSLTTRDYHQPETSPYTSQMSVYASPSARPIDVTDLQEENDVAVISSQLSSDELVNNEDISTTHTIIEAGREEDKEANGQTVVSFNIWSILRKGAINLVLPFINGIMLGFGEIFAHEVGFKYGFVGARVQPPRRHLQQKPKFI